MAPLRRQGEHPALSDAPPRGRPDLADSHTVKSQNTPTIRSEVPPREPDILTMGNDSPGRNPMGSNRHNVRDAGSPTSSNEMR